MEARLRFLEEAAKTYAIKAPAISAHLMLERAAVLGEHDINESRKGPKDICPACGTISVPGVTSTSSVKGSGSVSRRVKKSSQSGVTPTMKSLETKCLACHRISKIAIQQSKRQSPNDRSNMEKVQESKISRLAATNSVLSLSQAAHISTNVSSKQRAKARKKGLHALVERSKESNQAGPSFGLDLMDFMKEA